MASPLSYKPADNDYKVWLVLNPAKWLVPIWVAVLLAAVVIHAVVFSDARYDYLNTPAKAEVAQPK